MRRSSFAATALLAACAACNRGADLQSPDPEVRAEALRRGVASHKADLAILLVAQRDRSAEVRRAAAEAFAAQDGAGAVDALAALVADLDPEVAAVAARGLAARPGDARARDALLAAYPRASPASRIAIARALEDVGTSLREAVEREARALWERNLAALAAGEGVSQAGAAEEIGASARSEAVARLLPLVDPNRNPDPFLAAAAARGLGEASDWSARRHLEALLGEGDAALVEAAAAALARLGDPAAADALAAVADEPSGRMAAAAVSALEELPEASEVGLALCDVAHRTSDAALAGRAARAAAQREAECPVKPLLARLASPSGAAAAAALAELAPGASGADADAIAARLVTALDPARTPDPRTRAAVARALARLRPAAAATPVRDRLVALRAKLEEARARASSQPPAQQAAAAPARSPSVRPGSPPGRPGEPLVAGVPNPEELGALAEAAGAFRLAEAQAWLPPLATDPAPEVRAGALRGLALLGAEAAAERLVKALDDPDRDVRTAAVEGLAKLGPRGVPGLAAASQKAAGDPDWLQVLARGLGDCNTPDAVPALIPLLDGPAAATAAVALGRLGAPAGPLAAALTRPGQVAQVEIIDALAQVAAAEAAPALTDQLCAERPDVRAAAARALGRIRYEGASPRLEALRSDYYGRVRRAAVEALAKLPSTGVRSRP